MNTQKFFFLIFRHYKILRPIGTFLVASGIVLWAAGMIPAYLAFFPIAVGICCFLFFTFAHLENEAARHEKKCQEEKIENLCPPFKMGTPN